MSASSDPPPIPAGFTFVEELHGQGVFGRVFVVKDERLEGAEPPDRVLRSLFCPSDAGWRPQLLKRLGDLANVSIPHLSTPLESGFSDDDHVYTISHKFSKRLWDTVERDTGLEEKRATRIIEELLTALTGLHDLDLAHGDVRLRNVHLVSPAQSEETAWLVDAVIGELTSWGYELDENAKPYYPPEWNNRSGKASKKADLFSLGLVAAELLLGTKANPLRDGSNLSEIDVSESVQSQLKNRGIKKSTRRLIQELLEKEKSDRPTDARDAWEKWRGFRKSETKQPVVQLAIGVFLLIVIAGLGTVLSIRKDGDNALLERDEAHQSMLGEEQAASAALRKDKARVEGDLELEKGNSAELQSQLKARKETHAKALDALNNKDYPLLNKILGGKRPPEQPPKSEWAKALDLDTLAKKPLADRFEDVALKAALFKFAPPKGKKHFAAWINTLRGIGGILPVKVLRAWLNYDTQLPTDIEKCLKSPWDEAAVSSATARLRNLQAAAKVWTNEADNSKQTVKNVVEVFAGQSPAVKTILLGWMGQLASQAGKGWHLQPLVAAEKKGKFSNARMLTFWIADENQASSFSYSGHNKHIWKTAKYHKYKKEKRFTFPWKPDQSFGLRLLRDVTGPWDEDIIEHHERPFRGPFAIWLAHRKGRVTQGTASFTFRILPADKKKSRLFGPPPEAVPEKKDPRKEGEKALKDAGGKKKSKKEKG